MIAITAGFAAQQVQANVVSWPLRTSVTAIFNDIINGEPSVFVGRLDETNELQAGTDYVAFVAFNGDDAVYQFPQLAIELADGGIVNVDQTVYEQRNWAIAESGSTKTEYLSVGDEVVVAGSGYEAVVFGTETRGDGIFIEPDFVFRGSYDEFLEIEGSAVERQLFFGRILTIISLISVFLIYIGTFIAYRRA